MSARLIRKVLNEQYRPLEVKEDEEANNELNGEESASPESASRPSINPFDLLNEDDSEPDQGSELTSANESLEQYDEKEKSPSQKYTAVVSTSNPKSKKKKKKKSKDSSISNKDRGEKELDQIIENLSLNANSSTKQHTEDSVANAKDQRKIVKQQSASILQLEPKYLNAENELRRIFGSKVVKSFESSNQASSSRQIRGVRRGHYNLRKTVLAQPADHWPRWDGSLSMEFLETKDGYNYFR